MRQATDEVSGVGWPGGFARNRPFCQLVFGKFRCRDRTLGSVFRRVFAVFRSAGSRDKARRRHFYWVRTDGRFNAIRRYRNRYRHSGYRRFLCSIPPLPPAQKGERQQQQGGGPPPSCAAGPFFLGHFPVERLAHRFPALIGPLFYVNILTHVRKIKCLLVLQALCHIDCLTVPGAFAAPR